MCRVRSANAPPHFGRDRSRLGCASAAKPGTLYRKGVDAFEADDMQGAVTALAGVRRQDLPADEHRQALPRGVHQARPRARARWDCPPGPGPPTTPRSAFGAAHAGRSREGGSSIARRPSSPSGAIAAATRRRSSSCIATRSATSSTRARCQVLVDFEPVVTKDKDANELHSSDYRRIWAAPRRSAITS